jgi:hypothetical protein
MEQFPIGELLSLQAFVASLTTSVLNNRAPRYSLRADQYDVACAKASRFQELINELGLPLSAHWANEVVKFATGGRRERDIVIIEGNQLIHLQAALGEITNNLGLEAGTRLFVTISPTKVSYYQPAIPVFGKDVVDKFPNTITDMFEAGNCYALGRNTACVFHLMRLMEAAAQSFGVKLGVTLAGELVWQKILDRLNPIIKGMDHKHPLTVQYAAIQAHLYNVKVAWRNEVMHPKATYDELEALDIFNHVRAFLAQLVNVL